MTSAATPSVVVIRFSSLGDCILTSGVLEQLASDHSGSRLIVVTKPSFGAVFRMVAGVHHVLELDAVRHAGFLGLGRLARAIVALNPAQIVDLHGTLRARILRLWIWCLGPGIRWRAIRKDSVRRRWLVWRHGRTALSHITARYARAALGQTVAAVPPRLSLVSSVPRNRSVALIPGAAWATKKWPVQSFVDLAGRLMSAGWQVQVLGGDHERDLVPYFESLPRGPHVRLAVDCRHRPMQELASILARQWAVVANDTGLMHMASAVGTPVVAIFGPTAPNLGFAPTGPRDRSVWQGTECSPCTLHGQHACPRGHHQCMRELRAETVWQALTPILETYKE